MQDVRQKIIRIVAVDKRYIKEPYPAIAVWDSAKNCYLTGQHIDPSVASTRQNLTVDEMTGKRMLSEEKIKRFPYIINPEETIRIIHMMKLDISKDELGGPVNPVDYAKFIFIKGYCPFVANAKTSVRPGTDYFYIEDLEAEAEERVKVSDLKYEAEKCVREKTTIRSLKDIALMLNYKIKNFSIPFESMTEVRVKDELLKACDKHYNEVISCYRDDANEEIYIYKLVFNKIIDNKNGAFYDGSFLVGTSVDAVKIFMKSSKEENQRYINKWGKLLLEKEGKIPVTTTTDTGIYSLPDFESDEKEIEYLTDADLDTLRKYAGTGKRYKGAEWKELEEDKLREYLIGKLTK